MILRPPSHSWPRGLIGAALGGCLSQIVLAGCAAFLYVAKDEPENVYAAVLPAILFGACGGFACGFPAGHHSIGLTAIILFAAFILIATLASPLIASRTYVEAVEVIVLRYIILSLAILLPTVLLVLYRLRRHQEEWDARERCGIDSPQSRIMQVEDDD